MFCTFNCTAHHLLYRRERSEEMKVSLKAYRVNANLSVKEAAEIVGVTEKTIRAWESDLENFKKANWQSVSKLAKAYGVTTDDLRP